MAELNDSVCIIHRHNPRYSLFLFLSLSCFLSLTVFFISSSSALSPSVRPISLSLCTSLMITHAINRYLGTSLNQRLSLASVHPFKQQDPGSLINEWFCCGLPRTLIPVKRVIVNRSVWSSMVYNRWKIQTLIARDNLGIEFNTELLYTKH